MKRKNLLNKKGFTLIELIVVIAILAILALILVPSITGYISKATDAKNTANARTYYSEAALEVATNPSWYDDASADYVWPNAAGATDGNVTVPGTDNDMYCTFSVSGGAIQSDFACSYQGDVYAYTDDFKLSE